MKGPFVYFLKPPSFNDSMPRPYHKGGGRNTLAQVIDHNLPWGSMEKKKGAANGSPYIVLYMIYTFPPSLLLCSWCNVACRIDELRDLLPA